MSSRRPELDDAILRPIAQGGRLRASQPLDEMTGHRQRQAAADHGVEADDPTLGVDQRPTRVARLEPHICADELARLPVA
jgi:hypothetical protein